MLSGLDAGASLWIAFGAAAVLAGFFLFSRLNYDAMPRLRPPESGPPPDCMVVIPARNEEFCIARAVTSLPHDTVIVVDDHSTDHTAEAARQAGAGVVPAPELPRGAVGKSNACMAGARLITSRWILFTDADTWFEPGFLDAAVHFAETEGFALVSFYLRPETESMAARILIPYAAALYFAGVRTRGDSAALFNGQCVLVRREPYEFLGAHGALLNTFNDDVKLAALAARHRLKIASVRADDWGHVAIRDLKNAFRRGAFRLSSAGPWIPAAIATVAITAALWLPLLAWLLASRQWAAALLFTLLPSVFLQRWYGSTARSLLAPAAIYLIVPLLISSAIAVLTGRTGEWKGRKL